MFDRNLQAHLCPLFSLLPLRKWHTTWTCAMAWWVAFSAAAPDRPCSPHKWCVTPTCTQPPSSTCCTTPLATSSELHTYWWVSGRIRGFLQSLKVWKIIHFNCCIFKIWNTLKFEYTWKMFDFEHRVCVSSNQALVQSSYVCGAVGL